MSRGELRRRLQAVDPGLTIVSGGRRGRRGKGEVDWELSKGAICPLCGREVFRMRDGICMICWEEAHEIELRDTTGITNWLGEGILAQITHLANKEQ